MDRKMLAGFVAAMSVHGTLVYIAVRLVRSWRREARETVA